MSLVSFLYQKMIVKLYFYKPFIYIVTLYNTMFLLTLLRSHINIYNKFEFF